MDEQGYCAICLVPVVRPSEQGGPKATFFAGDAICEKCWPGVTGGAKAVGVYEWHLIVHRAKMRRFYETKARILDGC